MKNLRMLMCLAGGAALFGLGCGAPPEETPAEQQPTAAPAQDGTVHQMSTTYTVCWPALGIYEGPGTNYPKDATLSAGSAFYADSLPFSSNGDYWIRGTNAPPGWIGFYGYVRWDGLCH